MHLIISCSLNQSSKSRMLAEYAYNLYCKDAKFIDLQKIELPICDGDKCYEEPIVDELKGYIENSRSILLASPIYNYDLNAVAKNLIELTGKSWEDRVVGFISAAGGKGSYMSPMSFVNSLMLDFRCIIIPRFVYADQSCFNNNGEINDIIKVRIEKLVDSSILFSKALITL
mgnify:CR=1 FL=1